MEWMWLLTLLVDIYNYWMKKKNLKQCLDLFKKNFIELLSICTIGFFCESLTSNAEKRQKVY